ncbi:polycystic kidney disease 2-like 1 protein [Frankliniella occidentalis]|uniref:Polycystic kidney disease 2-like 1 protein n=1 Tax=Frankliniella occidentalis TaxID=133901 RepID=A0A6J1TRK7_FRAOC|nr:polycystic kidney disease 2-like 1 protein [Frankliniella occidentalis]
MFRSASSVRQPRLPRAPVRNMADAAHRLLCAQRVLRRWAEDRTLEHQEFKAMWTPFRGIMTHVFILVCFNLLSMCRIDLFIFYTRDALDDFYLNNHFPEGPVNQMIVFSEVDTVERLWSFVDYLVDSTGEEDPPSVTMHNPLLGNIRLRQVRVRGEPCVVAQWPELDEDYDKCFRFLSSENEDREPFGLGEAGGEAWVYREDEEGDPAYGYLSMYPPGGYWTHLPRDDEEAQELVDTLKVHSPPRQRQHNHSALGAKSPSPGRQNNSWVDAATRAVFVDLVTYNANLNYLSLTVVFFELPPGGGVVSRLVTRTAPLMQYATQFDAWRLGHELVFLVCSAVLTVGALLRALRHLCELLDQ